MCGIRSSTHSYPQQRLPKPNQISYMLIQFISFPFRFGHFHSAQWAFSSPRPLPPSPHLSGPHWVTTLKYLQIFKKKTNKQACAMPGTITDTSCNIDLRLKCCFWGDIFPFHLLNSVIYKTSDTSRKMFLENDCLLFVPLVFSGTLCQKSLQKSLSTLSTRASVTLPIH